jgi:hypothetical protein
MKSYARNIATSWSTIDERFSPPALTGGSKIGWSTGVSCPESNKGDFVQPTNFSYNATSTYRTHGMSIMTGTAFFNKGMRITTSGNLDCTMPPLPGWDDQTSVYNDALGKLSDLVRGSLDLSVALGEAGTTAKMLKSTAQLLGLAKGRRPYSGFGGTKDIANGYLQWKYGWKPLMSDIFDAANESINLSVNFITKVKARARMPLRGNLSSVSYPTVGSCPNVPFVRTLTGGWKQSAFQRCEIGVCLGLPQKVHDIARWSSLNPASIAWELMPYSFVVDWFVDIGSYLRNFETGLLYNSLFKYGYVSHTYRFYSQDECESFTSHDDGTFIHKVVGVMASQYQAQFFRSKLAAYPLPYRPTFKADLGSGQLLSAAALLRQLIGKK